MNDTTAIAQEREEIIQRSNEFPINFEVGTPFGVSERTTIIEDTGETKGPISPEETLSELLSLSDLAPMMGRFIDDQLERWSTILRKMPNNHHILNNIGMAYLSKGDIGIATMYFTKALEVKKDFRPSRTNIAKAYIMQGKFDEALAIYSDDEKRWPKDSSILMNIAHVYLDQGKLDAAKDMLDRILSFDSDNAAAYHNRGTILVINRKLSEAMADFRKALSINVRSTATYNALGICYMLQKNYQRAIKYFTISLNIDKFKVATLRNLATAYQSTGDFAKAADLMEKHLLTHSMDADARSIAAFSYLKMKDYRRTLQHLEYLRQNWQQLLLDETERARILNNIGVTRAYMQKFVQAIEMYQRSIEMCIEPNMVIPYSNLIKLYLTQGRLKDAEALIDEYISREPSDYLPLIILAAYYYDHDDYVRSQELLAMVLKNDEENMDALILLSCIYSEAFEDLDRALDLSKRAYELQPSKRIAANNLAYAYLRKGHLREAKDILYRMQWQKDYFFAYATKGLLRVTEGNVREGTRLYDEAEKLAKKTEWKRLVRQKKHIELGRYYLTIGEKDKAERQLKRALSVNTTQQVYKCQAQRLLAKVC
ncbi:Photosystem I assembly protein Ycf3 [subsurface metagenome]